MDLPEPRPTTVVPPAPDGALSAGGMQALIHSVHIMAGAVDGLRLRLGEQLRVNAVDITALLHLYNHPDLRPSELGRTLHMGSPGLTALADRLIRAGYVERSPDPTDRRANLLRLSPAGLTAVRWVFDIVAGTLTDHLAADPDASANAAALAQRLIGLSSALESANVPQG